MSEAPDDHARVARVWLRALGRGPADDERVVVERVLDTARGRFDADPNAAEKLVSAGGAPVPEAADRVDLATWTIVASLVLNLDETISKP
jgi:hypothetical protein